MSVDLNIWQVCSYSPYIREVQDEVQVKFKKVKIIGYGRKQELSNFWADRLLRSDSRKQTV